MSVLPTVVTPAPVGVEVNASGQTVPLELDLADCEDLPYEFRQE